MKGKFKNICTTLLLVLFTSYYAGITLFPHVHTIDGKATVHSHPYAKGNSNTPEHTHSQNEVQLVQQLSLFLSLLALGAIALLGQKKVPVEKILYRTPSFHRQSAYLTFLKRGPPALRAF